IHHRETARHWRVALRRSSPLVEPYARATPRPRSSPVIRRAILVLLLVLAPLPAHAQSDTATTSFDVNGLKVILRRNTANDVVAANVYLLGGTQQLTPATQGIEAFLLSASELGTKAFPHEAARRVTAQLGTNIVIAP